MFNLRVASGPSRVLVAITIASAIATALAGGGSGCSGAIDGRRPGSGSPGSGSPGGSGGPGPTSGSPPGGGNGSPGNGGGGGGPGPAVCMGGTAPGAPRLWRLTHAQLGNTIADSFGFRVAGGGHACRASRAWTDSPTRRTGCRCRRCCSTTTIASPTQVGDRGGDRRSGELLELPAGRAGPGNLPDRTSSTTVAVKAWRRPLSAAEAEKLTKLYKDASAAAGPETGFKMLVQGLVLSANFLYRTELGDGQIKDGAFASTRTRSPRRCRTWSGTRRPMPMLLDAGRGGQAVRCGHPDR